ncbi:hypothetical protein [Streptomyces hygroscopicus]|uniref:hypothetical protein n=1 Tax=Streptomyces hygroscopicus TaxID=1912 RepID=UPI00223EEB23|nr:hypothetical protein [Streptomyces hygroscopicus]
MAIMVIAVFTVIAVIAVIALIATKVTTRQKVQKGRELDDRIPVMAAPAYTEPRSGASAVRAGSRRSGDCERVLVAIRNGMSSRGQEAGA